MLSKLWQSSHSCCGQLMNDILVSLVSLFIVKRSVSRSVIVTSYLWLIVLSWWHFKRFPIQFCCSINLTLWDFKLISEVVRKRRRWRLENSLLLELLGFEHLAIVRLLFNFLLLHLLLLWLNKGASLCDSSLDRLFFIHLLLLLHLMLMHLVVEGLIIALLPFMIYYLHPFKVSLCLILSILILFAVHFLLLLLGHLSWFVNTFYMPLVNMRLFLFIPLLCIDVPLLIYVEWVPVHVLSSLNWLDFADCVEVLLEFTALILLWSKYRAYIALKILIAGIFHVSLYIHFGR